MNKRVIAQVLRDCVFSPTETLPMSVIAECGDPYYYQQRAIEMIRSVESQSRTRSCVPALKQAIALLTLAVAEIELTHDRIDKSFPVCQGIDEVPSRRPVTNTDGTEGL